MERRSAFSACAIVAGALVLSPADSARAEEAAMQRSLGSEHTAFVAPLDPPADMPAAPSLVGDITLRDAIAAALRGSPELATLSYTVRVREALAVQANVSPNPALGLEVEDFAGSGERSGVDSAQTTLSLAQLVELGGKRKLRARLAEAETTLSSWDFETRRIAVLSDATKAFVVVLAIQERAALARDLERLASETLRSVTSTVRAGAVSPVEEERARVNLERVQLEVTRADKELQAARALLAAVWGETQAHFRSALGDLHAVPGLPDPVRLVEAAPENPDLARWNAEIAQREAFVALERSRGVPDVTVSVGGRYFSDESDGGLVAGLSVPIPIFDRNRGGVLAARQELARARAARRVAEVSVRASVEAGYQALSIAESELIALRDRIIPRAERLFSETRRGYTTGLFRYVEVLDAERTLFQARRELLDALVAFHFSATDLERLTGTPLADLSGGNAP